MAGAWSVRSGRVRYCAAIGAIKNLLGILPIVLGLLITAWGQASIAQTRMALPGNFSVGTSGAALYNIPIAVPPGTAGMAPSLALEYNSQGANGIVGVGWTLNGLPSIGRCPQTPAQDGVRGSVNYDANDRFCLDGQRLIAISGSYGADGAEYRTEIDSFSRVISHGTAGAGPAWFEVHTKAGQIMEFGHTTDSLILAVGKSIARSWAVNKVSDTKGNYFSVTYTNDTTNGQAYPIEVDYTGNAAASLTPYNKVQFAYAARQDTSLAYQAGSINRTTVVLTDVKTYAGSSLVADYKLAYALGADTGRSHLSSITLCDGTGASCLPATTLSWTDNAPGTFTTASSVSPPQNFWTPYLGDFNGDGNTDILWCNATYSQGNSCNNPAVFWLSKGDGTFTTANSVNPPGAYWLPFLGDFNGDGKTDILWCNATNNQGNSCNNPAVFWFSKGDGTFTTANTVDPPGQFWTPYLGDFDGDGRTDILWCNATYSQGNSCNNPAVFWLSKGDGTFTTANTVNPPGAYWLPFLGDFNGDGKTDIMWCNATYSQGNSCNNPNVFWLSKGDGTFTVANTVDPPGPFWLPYLADFNGDGKTDILWCNATYSQGNSCNNPAVFWLSKGDGTFTTANSVNPPGQYWTPYLIDFNGDGKTDILWCNANYSQGNSCNNPSVFWQSKGDGTFTTVNTVNPPGANWLPYPGDFNGDGKSDILWCNATYSQGNSCNTPAVFWLSNGPSQNAGLSDLVASVATGFGWTTTITYQPLTKSSVYTKDVSATYPVQDLQPPMHVVSRTDAVNGIGGVYSTAYSYVGAKVDLSGRGPLGFRQVTAKDLQTNIVQTSTYRQDFPYIGLAASAVKTLSAQTLSQTTTSYQFVNATGGTTVAPGSAPYRASVSQSVEQSSDVDGTALPTATSNYQYDIYNNVTQLSVSTSDGYGKTTSNTYTNDTTNWFLGRLVASSVAAQAPQQLGQYCSLPWGGTISNGQSATAYSAATAPVGQDCSALAQTRTCTNGTLSGSSTQQSCTPAACSLPWGGTLASGQSTTAYSAANPPAGQSCSTIAQTRTCSLGALSGSYTTQSCTALCTLPWGGTIAAGQSVTAYPAASMPAGQTCASAAETRTCSASGVLSGSKTSQSCSNTIVTISSSTNNLNLWNYLVANSQSNGGSAGTWLVTVPSGVVIGSTSTATPAFDTGTFPSGSTLQLTNNGTIAGHGGAGGAGGSPSTVACGNGSSGGTGGPAIQFRIATTVTNNGSIWGGGGGGAGGGGSRSKIMVAGGGGGGGAGVVAGSGGAGGSGTAGYSGAQGGSGSTTAGGAGGAGGGTGTTAGGSGGGPGLGGNAGTSANCSAGSGGAAGSAVLGNSFVNWIAAGDRRGPLN